MQTMEESINLLHGGLGHGGILIVGLISSFVAVAGVAKVVRVAHKVTDTDSADVLLNILCILSIRLFLNQTQPQTRPFLSS